MKYTIFTLLAIFSFSAGAQQLDMDAFKNFKPRNIGPAGMSGRITSIDVVTDDPDIIYIGSASGGVWKSTSGGIDWKPVFDEQSTASIGAVAIQQSNPSVVWVGTGEGNPRNSLNSGNGIYRSLDGGKTWKKMGLEKTRHIHRIIIHPENPNTIYVAAIGSPWGAHAERGVYRTTNGGKSWERVLFNNNRTGAAELIMDPTNPNKLIAAMWEHKREPWFFKSGGSGSGLYVTHDGGDTWQQRTSEDGLPEGELGRIGLAIAPSRPNVIYALVEAKKNGLYRSADGGFTWTNINDGSDIGNRPFYYSEIYVDPVNENRVYSIFTYVNVSVDGGKSFDRLMGAYYVDNGVHPDHHAWYIHPEDPNFMIDGNDGGLNITRDRGETWRFVENLPVGQFYHVAVDDEIPYNIYGGMQDNGSWAGPAYVWKAQGIRNHYWQEISFGDGFDVLPDPRDSRFGISTSQQGYASIYDRKTGYNEMVRPTYPDGKVDLRFNWNVGMARDPQNADVIYFGSQFVHKSTDGGQTWEIISPDLTTNDPAKQRQGESGGLTMDATGAENYCTILVIEPSPLNQDILWVGTDDGNVQLSRNGGDTWTNQAGRFPELPKGAWISQIKASNKNEGEALMVANDYRRFNYEPYAYRTTDFGQTWERIVDSKDVISYTLAIVEDPVEKNLLFLGTDDGLYVSIDAGSSWTKWTQGFPTTNAYDLVIHPRAHDLVIGTFGRSFWVLDDIRPLRKLAADGISTLANKLTVYDPPIAYIAATQQPKGTRFGGDALYNGENKPSGAMVTYSINRSPKKASTESKKKKKKQEIADTDDSKPTAAYDSVFIDIVSGDQVVRRLNVKAPKEDGIHRIFWDLRDSPADRMARTGDKGGDEPEGIEVLPGTYKIVFSFGDQKDSTSLQVAYDPRIEITNSELNAKFEALKSLKERFMLGLTAVKRLNESIKITNQIQVDLTAKDTEAFKSQIERCTNTIDSLNALLNIFVGKVDDRQGITRNSEENIRDTYENAVYYVSNGLHEPGVTETKLIAKFEQDLAVAIERVNAFYQTNWKEFRAEIEDLDTSPFQVYDEIK